MSDSLPLFWGRRTFSLITGASKGIGRQLAIEFSRKIGDDSILVLFSRSQEGLDETKALILQAKKTIKVKTVSVDLTTPNSDLFSNAVTGALTEFNCKPTSFDLAMIVHNAGSVGDVSEKTTEMTDSQKWLDHISFNLISAICLNSVFLNIFPVELMAEICVINVTSLCGIQPLKSMGYYCTSKASREMFFRVLALENPSLNVISYSPGPVDTDMQLHVAENIADPEVKAMFASIRTSGKILTTEQTTQRCCQILGGRKYKSGDHIDYFDKDD